MVKIIQVGLCEGFGYDLIHILVWNVSLISKDIDTETTLFFCTEQQDCIALMLLDLSAAFDTVDHPILLERLKEWIDLGGDVLDRVVSYNKH